MVFITCHMKKIRIYFSYSMYVFGESKKGKFYSLCRIKVFCICTVWTIRSNGVSFKIFIKLHVIIYCIAFSNIPFSVLSYLLTPIYGYFLQNFIDYIFSMFACDICFVCLFVVFRPTREFFFTQIWRWRMANFDQCSALTAT